MARGTKCEFLGLEFDSIPELKRAQYLYSLEADGVISGLVLDKNLLCWTVTAGYVIPEQKPFHKRIPVQPITYTVDYKYQYMGYTILEDFKALRKGKGKKAKPHVERDSRLRSKLLRRDLPEKHVFRICYDVTAAPNSPTGYYYR